MDELLDDFIAETRDTLDAIAGELVAWEGNPADHSRLDGIFRFVHTVKGSCGFLDLPRLERLSHAAEDALAEVRSGRRAPDAALVDAVLAIIDRIGELTDSLQQEGRLPDGDDDALIEALTHDETAPVAAAEQIDVQPRTVVARSIRLPVELLDRMMAGVSDMVLARNELSRELRGIDPGAGASLAFERLSQCLADVRNAVTRTRMARVESLFAGLPRLVRDLSSQLGRKVRLEIDGGDVELDREMIEMIRDPLTHIVRNAIDHGIEPAEDRLAAGKSATGLLRIAARQSGNQILIDAVDDGRGINGDALIRKAVTAGLLTAQAAEALSWPQKLDFIFSPGLSTASKVTAISGRGVGMDVVRANIERIGGTVDVDSRVGHGVRLTMRVPLTLTIIPALIVGCGDHRYAIPRSAIDEIVRLNGEGVHIQKLGDGRLASVRGSLMPVVELGRFLDCAIAANDDAAPVLVVLRASFGERFALMIDQVFDHEELVVKPAAPAVMATGFYAGTTLPDNSRPMLLIDVAGLAAAAGIEASPRETRFEPADTGKANVLVPTLLFHDLDGVDRAIALPLVERIEDIARRDVGERGPRLTLAHRGEILPLHASAALPEGDMLRMILLGDGDVHVGYAIANIVDVVDLEHDLVPAATPGPVAGLLLVEGRQVELLDPHWLFASAIRPAAAQLPVCRIPAGPWGSQVLAPLLTAAGYRVADDRDAPADIAIVMADDAEPAEDGAVVRLRSLPDPSSAGDRSIWRYDRQGLLDALRTVQGVANHG